MRVINNRGKHRKKPRGIENRETEKDERKRGCEKEMFSSSKLQHRISSLSLSLSPSLSLSLPLPPSRISVNVDVKFTL
jgi:hypothetical protein